MSSTATGSHPAEAERRMPLVAVDIDGGLVRLRTRYHLRLVERLRRLPGRRFIAERGEWVLPARREGLAELAQLLAELATTRSSASAPGAGSSAMAPGGSRCATASLS